MTYNYVINKYKCCQYNYLFSHGESEIDGHIQRVVYFFQQMTSKIKSLGACEQFYSILKFWFNVLSDAKIHAGESEY